MSFLSRRRANHAPPLQESGNFPRPSGPGSVYSVEKPASLRRKHIHFPSSLNKLAAKLTSKSSTTHSARGAPVANVGSPLAYWRSRSPSPAPSLDIRMPTGLGRRASELGEREDFEEYVMNGRPSERKRSISLPAAATQAARWRAANLAEAEAEEEAKRPALERISPELLSSVFSYASRADVLSLAQVSKSFSLPALKALYADLDLRTDDDERIEQCIASLASRRPVASYVRSFACRALPPPEGGTMSLSTVTFAIALTNMDQLQSLTLPHFDLRILCHTTFPLRHLTLLCKNITPEDFHALFTWLGRHPSLVSLSLPSLVLPSLPPSVHPLTPVDSSGVPSRPHTPRTPDTPSHDSDAPSHVSSSPFPPTVVPSLRRFDGPVSIAAALVPGRPVERVQLPIQHTLYDGLRPSALMSALATARDTLRTLVIKPASTKIDQRTLERVVMSAGAELGDFIETLEVHWVLDDEVRSPLRFPVRFLTWS
ncbi:hypothetical protein L226DRAFT_513637 [Lentinus tigrinus ALCF2SS1-7]|uniref:uncharacterized protein n=1 Tax=Lentinus tigrinus ALCF2SS1-7 TaxID=1328758 RepID=UPI001165EE47|nr:hypothetical protein L226DRAFT_513637 [Lentinus tigrinus ALCF2SS1-7]